MYPVMLNLEGKNVVIIGGGTVATHKIHKLIEQKAKITVISPTLTKELEILASKNDINWVRRKFVKDDVKGAFLVFAATNNSEVNKEVKKSCSKNQLVNIVDESQASNFYNTAILERGPLKIAISTEGASPLLAKQIKQDLNNFFEDGYEDYLTFLFEVRTTVKKIISDEKHKSELLREVLNEKYRKNRQERDQFLQKLKESHNS